jgi:hypothetical protein
MDRSRCHGSNVTLALIDGGATPVPADPCGDNQGRRLRFAYSEFQNLWYALDHRPLTRCGKRGKRLERQAAHSVRCENLLGFNRIND